MFKWLMKLLGYVTEDEMLNRLLEKEETIIRLENNLRVKQLGAATRLSAADLFDKLKKAYDPDLECLDPKDIQGMDLDDVFDEHNLPWYATDHPEEDDFPSSARLLVIYVPARASINDVRVELMEDDTGEDYDFHVF